MFRVWSPQPSIAVSPLADFTPSPNTRVLQQHMETSCGSDRGTSSGFIGLYWREAATINGVKHELKDWGTTRSLKLVLDGG